MAELFTTQYQYTPSERRNMPAGETIEEFEARMAAENAEASRRQEQQRAAERVAKRQQDEAAHEQRVKVLQEAYKAQARASFPGTDAQFEAAWPTLLADWQRRRVAEAEGQQHALLLASGRYIGF